MLLSWIGLFIILIVGLVIGVRWFEKSLWMGFWENWWAWSQSDTCSQEKLKIVEEIEADNLNRVEGRTKVAEQNYFDLWEIAYGCAGLNDQVIDLKQVLDWTRKTLNEKAHELEMAEQRLKVSEVVRKSQATSLRKRATLIREYAEHLVNRDETIDNLRTLLEASKKIKRVTPRKRK